MLCHHFSFFGGKKEIFSLVDKKYQPIIFFRLLLLKKHSKTPKIMKSQHLFCDRRKEIFSSETSILDAVGSWQIILPMPNLGRPY